MVCAHLASDYRLYQLLSANYCHMDLDALNMCKFQILG